MCGRYTITTDSQKLAEHFDAQFATAATGPRYNAAPTQDLPILRLRDAAREIDLYRWGLIPHWADDPAIGNRMINARAETLEQKPSFREAFRKRRCLVLADSFFEWQATRSGKVPVRFLLDSEEPFAIAGLWETWHGNTGEPIHSFTIITTTPNDLVAPVHNRMPALLLPEHEDVWLDPHAEVGDLHHILAPYPADLMQSYSVSTALNSPANNDPSVIERIKDQG